MARTGHSLTESISREKRNTNQSLLISPLSTPLHFQIYDRPDLLDQNMTRPTSFKRRMNREFQTKDYQQIPIYDYLYPKFMLNCIVAVLLSV